MVETIKVGDWTVEKSVFDEYIKYQKEAMEYMFGRKKTPSGTATEGFIETDKCLVKGISLINKTMTQLGITESYKENSDSEKFKHAFRVKAELIETGKVKL